MTARPCAYAPCGRPFYGNQARQRYCCVDCARAGRLLEPKPCLDCGTRIEGGTRSKRCPACAYRAKLARTAAYKRAQRSAAVYLTTGDASRRQRADAALDRGRANRRCPGCGRTYHLDHMDAPCPVCGDHLAVA